jgi:hypothetical protein
MLRKTTGLILILPLRIVVPVFQYLSRLLRRESPYAPWAGVRVPKTPVVPKRSGAVALDEPD